MAESVRMQPPTTAPTLLSVTDATALAQGCLVAIGLTADEAVIVADHLVDCELCGYPAAGLARIPALGAAPEMRQPRRPPAILRETAVSAVIAGGNSLGYVAMNLAVETAIAKAGQAGIAIVGLHDAWNSGRAAYWVERVARAGFAAIHMVSTPPLVVPEGASERGLGTNPMAFAFPGRPDPVVVDLATSTVSWADVLRAAADDEVFPSETGVDCDGRPTAKARDIVAGGLRPFGGVKGQALSFAIQAFGLMAGARRRRGALVDFGYLLVAFDPALLTEADTFERDLADLADGFRGLATVPGASALRLPGERAQVERRRRLQDGIAIPPALHDQLAGLGAALK